MRGAQLQILIIKIRKVSWRTFKGPERTLSDKICRFLQVSMATVDILELNDLTAQLQPVIVLWGKFQEDCPSHLRETAWIKKTCVQYQYVVPDFVRGDIITPEFFSSITPEFSPSIRAFLHCRELMLLWEDKSCVNFLSLAESWTFSAILMFCIQRWSRLREPAGVDQRIYEWIKTMEMTYQFFNLYLHYLMKWIIYKW